MQEFSKGMQEAGEASMKRVSLIISVLAVLVAMVTVLSHREHTEAVLAQARASDRWSEYQGRRIRQAEVGLTSDLLSLEPGINPAALGAKLKEYQVRTERVQQQLDEDTDEAKKLEAEVRIAEGRAARFDLGEALLQISVVLASITLLTRRSLYALLALVLGTAGILAAASAGLVH